MKTSEPENGLPFDEPDAEEGSPYRRRSRPAKNRRRGFWQRVPRLLRWAALAAVVLVPLGYGGYRLGHYALNSRRFDLRSANDVVVEGNQYVSRDEVLNALGLPVSSAWSVGINMFRLSLKGMRKQVESIDWVRSATLSRAYPHRLIVHIVEREPIAFVNVGGAVKLVDADGVLLEKPDKGTFAFPVISGLDAAGNPADRRARLATFQSFVHQMSDVAASAGWLVSEVNLSDADDLKAVLVQGRDTILVHFGHQEFAERFRDFLALIPEMRRTNAQIDSVDLRYRNQVVVNPQSAATLKSQSTSQAGAPKE